MMVEIVPVRHHRTDENLFKSQHHIEITIIKRMSFAKIYAVSSFYFLRLLYFDENFRLFYVDFVLFKIL